MICVSSLAVLLYLIKYYLSSKFKYMKKTILSLSLLLAFAILANRVNAQVSVGISVHIAPPAIPVYEQPPCPTDGYLWVPGYWAWDDDAGDYYWVPGYWSAPPTVGYLWTPGYWGWAGGLYAWHGGYWGPHVGYYGGINYGFGYGGSGYYGGEWHGGHFRYNTAVTRVNTSVVRNVYVNRTVINNVTVNRVSYNGGPGGINRRPDAREQTAMNDRHIERTNAQAQHQQAAMHDRTAFNNVNHGRPSTMATSRPTNFSRPGASTGNMGRPNNAAPNNVNRPNPAGNVNRPNPNPAGNVNRPNANPAGNRPNPAPNVNRPVNPNPAVNNRPAPNVNRPAPNMSRPTNPAVNHPQPQQFHQQTRPMNQPRPMNQARPAPQARPQMQPHNPAPNRPMPQSHPAGGGEHPGGGGERPGGGGGGEHHHR
jgi:hypothetical protein